MLAPAAMSSAPVVVDIATGSQAAAWDRFVSSHPNATGYHSWDWREVFARTFGHESIYFSAVRDGHIVGVLPTVYIESCLFGRSLTSLPFLNYGGVVADDVDAAAHLVEAAAEVARQRKCPHLEMRHIERQFPDLPARQHKVTMLLRIESGMWERLDRKVRNQIRKAQKSGLTAGSGGVELLDEFYTVFARNMRDLGTPVYPRQLFAEVLRAFPSRAALQVVRLGGRPVAAALTYRTRATVEVPWASSIRDYNSLCPNHLLYWNVCETAVADGCEVLDFGRSTPGEGTFKFKAQWGAVPVPLHWEYRMLRSGAPPNLSPTNPKYRLMIQTWKRLPVSVATAIGPHIVGNIA